MTTIISVLVFAVFFSFILVLCAIVGGAQLPDVQAEPVRKDE